MIEVVLSPKARCLSNLRLKKSVDTALLVPNPIKHLIVKRSRKQNLSPTLCGDYHPACCDEIDEYLT